MRGFHATPRAGRDPSRSVASAACWMEGGIEVVERRLTPWHTSPRRSQPGARRYSKPRSRLRPPSAATGAVRASTARDQARRCGVLGSSGREGV
jgi:hypothetical protein